MLFSLKLQRDNRKNALAVDPAEGKTGKRLYFSLYCGDETTTYYNRALFDCCKIMKIQAFTPFAERLHDWGYCGGEGFILVILLAVL